MKNVIVFKSKSELGAVKNIDDFVIFCKEKLTLYEDVIDWNKSEWKGIAIFRKLNTGKGIMREEYTLDANFINFAKSYIRYQQSLNPVKNLGGKMMALRCLEEALLQVCQKAYIYNTTIIVLDEAIKIASQYYDNNVLYTCGYELERLSSFISGQQFLKIGILSWKNPIKPNTRNNYLPEKKDEERRNKLPDERALLAIAEIFSRQDEELSERDLFTSSVFALLMCSPSRISEILALPADCEITRNDKDGVERYGLRFYSVKGYGATIKWIPDVMVPVARKAISRLRRLSKNARSLARWHESSSDKFYRHDICPTVREDEPLGVVQVCHALGYPLTDKKQCFNKIKCTSLDGGGSFLNPADGHYTLRVLGQMIRKKLPADFPWFDKEKSVRYSNALCLLNQHQCNDAKFTARYAIYRPTYSFFSQYIEKIPPKGQRYKNIFERHGYLDSEGKPLSLRSHQPRHLLNTLAHLGELSELDIAKWSGRVCVTQNRNYNHTSQEQMMLKVAGMRLGNNRYCHHTDSHSSLNVGEDMDTLNNGAVHLTPNGYCIHDYLIPPCKKILKTMEFGWVGSDAMNEQQREQVIKKLRSLHQMTKQAVHEGFYGADKWLSYHENVLSILERQIKIKGSI
ncbi:hypothetical protein M977_02744 [Buttiauxella gaviniae ATCC 51604]|uniref:DNA-binding protein n=1 Tax=Buttiauxella gaviniae ATCC 51604 TaxID=1354253 RepID=A0A1B7HWZ7_9ENTR|nr:hypothetical protein [Buttiauxella gaviniae]OAT20213.1 hypothetical protein M977_02744 [Buttiauxella gaviniae ATCC 51604]